MYNKRCACWPEPSRRPLTKGLPTCRARWLTISRTSKPTSCKLCHHLPPLHTCHHQLGQARSHAGGLPPYCLTGASFETMCGAKPRSHRRQRPQPRHADARDCTAKRSFAAGPLCSASCCETRTFRPFTTLPSRTQLQPHACVWCVGSVDVCTLTMLSYLVFAALQVSHLAGRQCAPHGVCGRQTDC